MISGMTASMDSVYPGAGAARAVDGDMDTEAHSLCRKDSSSWLELDLNNKYAVHVSNVVLICNT